MVTFPHIPWSILRDPVAGMFDLGKDTKEGIMVSGGPGEEDDCAKFPCRLSFINCAAVTRNYGALIVVKISRGNYAYCDADQLVKLKQRLPSERDWLILVQSSGKKYVGFLFETVMNNVATPIQVKSSGDRDRIAKATTTASTFCTDPKAMSLSSPTTDSNLILAPRTPTLNSISNINVRKRPAIDSSSAPRKKKNKSKKVQEGDDTSSSDTQPDEDNFIKLIEPIKTPTFNGRRLASVVTTDSTINRSMDKDSCSQSMEQKYFMPLLIGQERLEMKMKSLYNNQMKIQKALTKDKYLFHSKNQQINIDTIDVYCGRAVALEPADTYSDNRYKLIQRAVRSKFKLSDDQLEQIFNEWLREVFLAKRRVAVSLSTTWEYVRKFKCKGRIHTNCIHTILLHENDNHNHPGNPVSTETRIFEEKILHRALNSNEATQNAIDYCLTNLSDNIVARLPDFKHAKRNIQNRRGKTDLPEIPHDKTFNQISDKLTTTNRNSVFLQFNSGPGSDRIIIFASAEQLQLLEN
ncbi:unnamed protein product [Rotaria socialis]|uniref:Uncharacterized protein n=3 Tax=Rotaria socialis TaxID=392032 RepID=A0A820TBF1_9BILA|nr:unnamed protein product [Rotaria socialis]